MRILLKLLQIIYTVWVAIWFIGIMLILSPFLAIPALFGKRGVKISYFFLRLWAGLAAIPAFIRFKVEGKENIQKGAPAIFVINHTSYLDAPAIPFAVPVAIKAIGKKELSKVPIFGFLVRGFAVWVDRASPESRRKSLKKIRKVLKAGNPIAIAPEGTRNNTKDLLLPFKDGAFRLALETQVPVSPIIILDANKLMPRGTFLLKPGSIRIKIFPPIPIPEGSNVQEYKAQTRQFMENAILDMRAGKL